MSTPNTPETPDHSDNSKSEEGVASTERPEPGQQPQQPPQYAPPPQYTQPQQPQQPQYAPPQYLPPQPSPNGQPQYGQAPQPQYGQPPQYVYQQPQQQQQYAQPQYPGAFPAPGPGEPFDGAMHPGELNRPLYGASFGQAFIRFFKNYANFNGRASRSEYWWMVLILSLGYIGVTIVGAIFSSALDLVDTYGSSDTGIVGGLLGLTLIVAMLGLIVPIIALHWRRFHDVNLAGPLYLLSLIPWVGSLVVLIFSILAPKPEGRRFDRPFR